MKLVHHLTLLLIKKNHKWFVYNAARMSLLRMRVIAMFSYLVHNWPPTGFSPHETSSKIAIYTKILKNNKQWILTTSILNKNTTFRRKISSNNVKYTTAYHTLFLLSYSFVKTSWIFHFIFRHFFRSYDPLLCSLYLSLEIFRILWSVVFSNGLNYQGLLF